MMAYKKCIVLCYLLLWMYCLENKVLTFVSDKNYTEYNCTTSITGQRALRSLQTSASISSLPFSSSSSLSWKSFVSKISTQEIKQMIYWQLFCVQIYFFTPPKFIVPTFLPFPIYLNLILDRAEHEQYSRKLRSQSEYREWQWAPKLSPWISTAVRNILPDISE